MTNQGLLLVIEPYLSLHQQIIFIGATRKSAHQNGIGELGISSSLAMFSIFAGNFFFAGARLFLCSMEAAIFLFSRVARIPEGSIVLPAIRTESSITLGAELVSGNIIRGQNQISHPIHDCESLFSLTYRSVP